MTKTRLTRYEQETIVNFNAENNTATLYTADPVQIRKYDKYVAQNPNQFKIIDIQTCQEDVISKTYEFPKKFVTVRKKETVRTMTEEQRRAASDRMRKIGSLNRKSNDGDDESE